MRWITKDYGPRGNGAAIKRALLNTAFKQAGSTGGLERLGAMLLQVDDTASALHAFELARRADPDGFAGWQGLAQAYLREGRPADALAASDAAAPGRGLAWIRGRAQEALGQFDAAAAALGIAFEEAGDDWRVFEAWLRVLAQCDRPAALLAAIDALPDRFRSSAAARAYRAIGLSQSGRDAAALALVDLDRHVACVQFTPPPTLGTIERCNAVLAADILRREPEARRAGGFSLRHNPPLEGNIVVAGLHDFIRFSLEQFVREMPDRGLAEVMPPPSGSASLYVANLVLTDGGSNGEHIHARGYLSAVYYVAVPLAIRDAADDRGALLVGAAASVAGGHTPCWGVRAIKPVAGMLVIMPSHIFHDVAPSHTPAPRISIAVDMVAHQIER